MSVFNKTTSEIIEEVENCACCGHNLREDPRIGTVLTTMPIFCTDIEIDVGTRCKLTVIHDFNARFTKDVILIVLFINEGWMPVWHGDTI